MCGEATTSQNALLLDTFSYASWRSTKLSKKILILNSFSAILLFEKETNLSKRYGKENNCLNLTEILRKKRYY